MKISLIMLALAFASTAAAEASDCASPTSQAAMNACSNQVAKKSDAALNRAYGDVKSRLGPAGQLRLRDAQRAWLAFRYKECMFESSGPDGGSVAPMVADNCFTFLTDQRTHALAGFKVCTEGDVSCPR
jgi:uncharacterized protein YecT (DUF1311 family)